MKKTLILCTIILLSAGFLFASPSWVGGQGTVSYYQSTTDIDSSDQKNSTTLAGLNIAGTIYPGESPVGIGFQVGAAKTIKDERGSVEFDVEDYPLIWNGGVMAKFRASLTEMFALEIGAGLLYERKVNTLTFLTVDTKTTINTLSLLTAADLVIHLSDSFAFVGGIGVSFPLSSQGKYTIAGTTYEKDLDVKGFTISGKVGAGFSF